MGAIVALIPLLGNLLDKFFPNAEDAAAAKLKLMEMAQNGELAALAADKEIALGQIAVNQAEATSQNIFVAGWRPFIGWICGLGLAYNFIGYQMLLWLAASFDPSFKPPPLVSDNLMELTLGMLGLAGFRTYEKIKGALK